MNFKEVQQAVFAAIVADEKRQYDTAYETYLRSIKNMAKQLNDKCQVPNPKQRSQLFLMMRNCLDRSEKISTSINTPNMSPVRTPSMTRQTDGRETRMRHSKVISWNWDSHGNSASQQDSAKSNEMISLMSQYEQDVERGSLLTEQNRSTESIQAILRKLQSEMHRISAELRFNAVDISSVHHLNKQLRLVREAKIFYEKLVSAYKPIRSSVDFRKRQSFRQNTSRRSKKRDASTARFVAKNFRYSDMTPVMLQANDKQWVKKVTESNVYPTETIQVHIVKIASDSKHALYKVIRAYAVDYKKRFAVSKDEAWCAVEPPLEDAHSFVSSLIDELQNIWEVTVICSDRGTNTLRAVLLPLVGSYILDTLLPIYRLQTDNHVVEQILLDMMETTTLESLEVPTELLLPEAPNPYEHPILTLNDINGISNAVRMVDIIAHTTTQIYQSVSDYWGQEIEMRDEDMIRVFLYVLLRANVPDMSSYLQHIEKFTLAQARSVDDLAEFGITMFTSAIRWCRSWDKEQKQQPAPIMETTAHHAETQEGDDWEETEQTEDDLYTDAEEYQETENVDELDMVSSEHNYDNLEYSDNQYDNVEPSDDQFVSEQSSAGMESKEQEVNDQTDHSIEKPNPDIVIPAPTNQVKCKDDPQLSRFFKMLCFGVPREFVAAEMEVEEPPLDPSLLDTPDAPSPFVVAENEVANAQEEPYTSIESHSQEEEDDNSAVVMAIPPPPPQLPPSTDSYTASTSITTKKAKTTRQASPQLEADHTPDAASVASTTSQHAANNVPPVQASGPSLQMRLAKLKSSSSQPMTNQNESSRTDQSPATMMKVPEDEKLPFIINVDEKVKVHIVNGQANEISLEGSISIQQQEGVNPPTETFSIRMNLGNTQHIGQKGCNEKFARFVPVSDQTNALTIEANIGSDAVRNNVSLVKYRCTIRQPISDRDVSDFLPIVLNAAIKPQQQQDLEGNLNFSLNKNLFDRDHPIVKLSVVLKPILKGATVASISGNAKERKDVRFLKGSQCIDWKIPNAHPDDKQNDPSLNFVLHLSQPVDLSSPTLGQIDVNGASKDMLASHSGLTVQQITSTKKKKQRYAADVNYRSVFHLVHFHQGPNQAAAKFASKNQG